MVQENFFILLDLPFDPPPHDPAEIKAAIHKKQHEWSRMGDSPSTKSAALHYIELLPNMEEVLLNPETRDEEAKKAVALRNQMMAPFVAELRVLEAKGYLHPRELKLLHEKYGSYGISMDVVKKHISTPITDTPPKKAIIQRDIKALDYSLVLELRQQLQILKKKDLYEFLGLGNQATISQLLDTAQKIYHQAFHATVKSGKTFAEQQLAELAMKVFETKDTKASYDCFLSVNIYPELNDIIIKEYEEKDFITPDILMRLVNFGVTTYTDTNVLEMEEYIRTFCHAYHISIDMVAPQTICPNCGESSPRGTLFCQSCAAPLEGNCPQCGTFFSDGDTICCNCSFSLGEMGKALPFLDEVKAALVENNWSSAQHGLNYVSQYWPDHPEIEKLTIQASAIEEHYNKIIQDIELAMHKNRFYAAQEMANDAKEQHISIPQHTLEKIASTLDSFEKQVRKTKEEGGRNYETLSLLSSHVADSLELNRMLAKYPPEPPTRFTARPDGNTVLLNWNKSSSTGEISYIVVRKENSVPLTAYDGDVVYENNGNSHVDDTIPPLKNYFYSVFANRNNTYSEIGAVAAVPVRIIPEVGNYKITPADGAAQLTWAPPANLKEVQIWRKTGEDRPTGADDGEFLKTTRLDGYTDKSLQNDETYWYFIRAIYYTSESGLVASDGIYDRVVPHKIIAPIDHYTVTPLDEVTDSYLVNWSGAPRDEIIFLTSQTKPPHPVGQMIPTDELLRNYNRVHLENQTSVSAQFRLRFNGGIYLFPVVISGRFGSVGRSSYITNVPDVENVSHDIVDHDLFVNFRWPVGTLHSVTVAWRRDSFPTSIEQKGTYSLSCSREQYDLDAGIRIPDISDGLYYLTIYSTFCAPDGDLVYSPGVELLVDNSPATEFFYTIQYKRPMLSSTYHVTLTIQGDEPFYLPKAIVVGKVGSVPLRITDGTPLFEIERGQKISGSITYEYKSEKLPKKMYARLFFFDEEEYKKVRPLPGKRLLLT